MGFIRIPIRLLGRKGEADAQALFDTGCTHSLMNESIASRIGLPEDLREPVKYEAVVGSFTARKGIFADMVIEGKTYPAEFRVVPALTEDVIVGHEFMQLWKVVIDMGRHVTTLEPKALKMMPLKGRPARRR